MVMGLTSNGGKPALVVEGWRSITHSYAIVNQWQLLALMKRSDIHLSVRDLAYFNPAWKSLNGVFNAEQEAKLSSLRIAADDAQRDATLRIGFPYDFTPVSQGRTAVFGTSEYRVVPADCLASSVDIEKLSLDPDFTVLTPSRWSAEGFLRAGFRLDQVAIIPHGVDTEIYRPDAQSREMGRKELGLRGFSFLSVGAMTFNKGIDVLLRAFARILEKHPDTTLVLKGADTLYNSKAMLQDSLSKLSNREVHLIGNRLMYLGNAFSMERMATLYQMADAYVSPYRAEGFNLPVLEAMACGLPVICTSGGSTEDFVNDTFALKIESKLISISVGDKKGEHLEPDVDHLTEHMLQIIDRDAWRREAALAGSKHAAIHYNWDVVAESIVDVLFRKEQLTLS